MTKLQEERLKLKARIVQLEGILGRTEDELKREGFALKAAQKLIDERDNEITLLKHEVTYYSHTVRSLHWSLNAAIDGMRQMQHLAAKEKTTRYTFDGKEWKLEKVCVLAKDELALAQ